MTARQKLVRLIYPLIKRLGKRKEAGSGILYNVHESEPGHSFYHLAAELIDGRVFNFMDLKGKKVLLVNVASNCGYTPQYNELEELNRLFKDKLVILAFPANDFKEQEPGTDKEIEEFCRMNYGITFYLFKKNPVLGSLQQDVFQWLSHKDKNGWNDRPPTWNFCKYLVDGNGKLQYFFASHISPLGEEMVRAIDSIKGSM